MGALSSGCYHIARSGGGEEARTFRPAPYWAALLSKALILISPIGMFQTKDIDIGMVLFGPFLGQVGRKEIFVFNWLRHGG